MASNVRKKYGTELQKIAKRDGLLRPTVVVDEARNPKNPLHAYFEWDDAIAGERHRVESARRLIRQFKITFVDPVQAKKLPARAWVSMTTDRHVKGGGYRSTETVMKSEGGRLQVLQDALEYVAIFRKKYGMLKELITHIDSLEHAIRTGISGKPMPEVKGKVVVLEPKRKARPAKTRRAS